MLHSPARLVGACGCTWSWSGVGVVAGRLRHRAVVGDPPVVDDDRPGDQRPQRAELVGDEQHRAAVGDEVAQRRRRTPPGWPRRRRRSARRGPAAPARPASARAIRVRCCWPPERVADRVAGPVGQADGARAPRRRRARSARARRAQEAPAGQPAGGDDLADGGRHAAAGAEPLRHVADARATAGIGAAACRRGATVAGAERHQAEHGADQGGLAGAVGAEDRDHLAGGHGRARRPRSTGPAVVADRPRVRRRLDDGCAHRAAQGGPQGRAGWRA